MTEEGQHRTDTLGKRLKDLHTNLGQIIVLQTLAEVYGGDTQKLLQGMFVYQTEPEIWSDILSLMGEEATEKFQLQAKELMNKIHQALEEQVRINEISR